MRRAGAETYLWESCDLADAQEDEHEHNHGCTDEGVEGRHFDLATCDDCIR